MFTAWYIRTNKLFLKGAFIIFFCFAIAILLLMVMFSILTVGLNEWDNEAD